MAAILVQHISIPRQTDVMNQTHADNHHGFVVARFIGNSLFNPGYSMTFNSNTGLRMYGLQEIKTVRHPGAIFFAPYTPFNTKGFGNILLLGKSARPYKWNERYIIEQVYIINPE